MIVHTTCTRGRNDDVYNERRHDQAGTQCVEGNSDQVERRAGQERAIVLIGENAKRDWVTGQTRAASRTREDDDETTLKSGDIYAYHTNRLTDVRMILQSTRVGTTFVTVEL